jgi:hypothetical protein
VPDVFVDVFVDSYDAMIPLSGVTTANSGTVLQAANVPIVVALPAGAAAGHVAVFLLETSFGAATVTGPTGWAEHANGDAGSTKIGLWSKTLDAADITAGSVSAVRTGSTSYAAILATWSGTSAVDAVSAQQATTTATTSVTIPAVTPVAANCLRLGVATTRVSTSNLAATATPPASWTEVAETIDSNATLQRRLVFIDSTQLTGQAGVAQATATATTSQPVTYAAFSLTLAPTPTGVQTIAGTATTTTTAAAAALTIPVAAVPGWASGFTKPGPFGVPIPAPPAPPAPSPELAGAPARPIVEIGFSTDPLVGGGLYLLWDDPQRLWDVALWAPDEVWADVSPWLKGFSFSRGATRVEGPVLRYEAGGATVVLNNPFGRFHPLNLAGPYVSGGRTQVRPMVPIRIRAAYQGVTYELWRGFVDAWDITYPSPDSGEVTVTATDAQKVIASHSRVALGAPVGTGELSGARVHRILNSVGWPVADRLVDAGKSTLVGTTLDGDAWTELLLVQDSELGEIYVDPNGKVVFKSRHAILIEAQSTTSQLLLGRHSEAGELPYVSLVPTYDDADVRNVVRIAREGGVQQEARDQPSIDEYLEKVHQRTDLLMQTDSEALDYAHYLLAGSKQPALVFAQVVVDPRAAPADLFPQVFSRDFGDRITIRSRPPGVGLIERDVFIRGISGEYAATNRWKWAWTLQPVQRGAPGLVWDVGKWDSGAVWVY